MANFIDDRLRELGFEPSDLQYSELDSYFDRGRQVAEGSDVAVTSSNVARIRYAAASDTLFVEFDNGREKAGPRLYMYHGISLEDIYDDLFSAASPGSVVWDRLRRAGVPFSRL